VSVENNVIDAMALLGQVIRTTAIHLRDAMKESGRSALKM
jgi:hypothetical protein